MEKQSAERDEEDVSNSMDRISQLPQGILHHILSFLSQEKAAQTSLLSKSWRYLWSTRPNVVFFGGEYGRFKGNKETFLAVLDKTLQGYHDQKLCIREFVVWMSMVDSESVSLLEKWIPIVTSNMGVKMLNLKFISETSPYFDVPSIVFEAESLQKLYLGRCKLNQNSIDKVQFKHLQTLHLSRVYIADETFDKIISSCPLIEYLSLLECEGLKTIKVNKLHKYLKGFNFSGYGLYKEHEDDTSIEIDVPTVEAIRIEGCRNWFDHHNYYFPNLKHLCLNKVRLSTKSFDCFSRNFPCLEELKLDYCHGFEEFQLLSRSIKHLEIVVDRSIKAAIDAPNILYFEFSGGFLPSLSFTTTSRVWKSEIRLHPYVMDFLKLNEVLKALSQSEISLRLFQHPRKNQQIEDPLDLAAHFHDFYKPVMVEHLHITLYGHSSSSYSDFVNDLFSICHPRNLGNRLLFADPQSEWEREHTQLAEFLCEILLMETETRHYLWQRDLEEVSMEAFDDNGKQWNPVRQGTSLPNNQSVQLIRFRLKWRELS